MGIPHRGERGVNPLLILLLALAVLTPHQAAAQYLFGKNKVVYSQREWLVSRSERIELFFYSEEQHLARLAMSYADSTCLELEQVFGLETGSPVPLVLYGSQHDFRETNVIPNLIPESVGGFTDLMRGRVVVPSTGDLYQLRHVIRHELVHAYMLEKLANVMTESRRYSFRYPPLWFVEGLAEFYSVGPPDTEGRMLLREGILEGSLPRLTNMWSVYGTYLMYKMGQSVVAFLDRNYSTAAVRGILEAWPEEADFDRVLQRNLGLTLEELDRRWRSWLRRRYFPAVGERLPAEERGREIMAGEGFQTSPTALSDSTFVFLKTTTGLVDLARAEISHDPRRRARERVLLRGGRNPRLESIPLFRSGPAVADGTIAITVRVGPRDRLLFVDQNSGEILDEFACDSLVQIESPTISAKGEIIFSGLDPRGRRDLYLLDENPPTEQNPWRLTRLTDDDCDDRWPSWHPDGGSFLFSSDRAWEEVVPWRNIFRMDPITGEVTRITKGDWVDRDPVWHPDGERWLYSSDRKGAWDIYCADGEEHRRQTFCYGAAVSPTWVGDEIVASVYDQGIYRLFAFRPDPEQPLETGSPIGAHEGVLIPKRIVNGSEPLPTPAPYHLRWGLDFVQAGLAYDPEFGSAGGSQIGFTDLLGNHQIMVALANNAQSASDILKRMNLGISYLNLERRWNWSLALFHLATEFDYNWEEYRYERRVGGVLGVRYPFNLFRRVEFSLNVRGVFQGDEIAYGLKDPDAVLASLYTAWVHDNTLWGYGGPHEGERINLTCGYTEGFDQAGHGYSLLKLDARKYWRLRRHTVFAGRLMGHYSTGGDPRFYHLGGPMELRGWPYHHFHSRGIWLLNQELRFPILYGLSFFTPIGRIDFPSIRGSFYFDAARLISRFYSIPQPHWAGSVGMGVELGFGPPVVIRWNMTRRTDFHEIDTRLHHQVFLGWNY